MSLPSFVTKLIQDGHTMRPDPEWSSTAVHRFMCETCDAEVYWTSVIVVGKATEYTCDKMIQWWENRKKEAQHG